MKIGIFSVKSSNIAKAIRKRYALALSIIAFLVILSQIIIQYNLHKQEGDSRVINIAGRQRMLSQKICKDAYGIYLASDEKIRNQYLDELVTSIDIWNKLHVDLKNGNSDVGLPGKNSYKIMQLFTNIESVRQLMLDTSYDIIKMIKKNEFNRNELYSKIQIIQENEDKFLKGMDAIVFQYDLESKEKVQFIKHIELVITIITFIVLILEAILIFMPAEKTISTSFQELKESRENLNKLFETLPSAIFLVDEKDLSVLFFNKQAEKLFKTTIKTNKTNSQSFKLDNIICNSNNTSIDVLYKIRNDDKVENQEVIINTDNDSIFVALISSIKMQFDNKDVILIVLSDITVRKQAEDVLRKQANYDELTGIYNRRYGWFMLENAYCKAKEGLIDLTVCFIDINDLKIVNDTFGHDEGDWYIKCIANTISLHIGNQGYVFRYGGDEMVISLLDCNYKQAESIINKIEESLVEIERKENKSYHISISCGIVNLSKYSSDTLEDFVKYADHIMYQNKRDRKENKYNI